MANLFFGAKSRSVQAASYSIFLRWRQPKHQNKKRRIPDRQKMAALRRKAARSGRIADAGKFALAAGAEINSQTETARWRLATEIVLNRERSFFGMPRPKRFSQAILQRGMLS